MLLLCFHKKVITALTGRMENMLVKYCAKCDGSPYTEDLSVRVCPLCGNSLSVESADDRSLSLRAHLPESEPTDELDTWRDDLPRTVSEEPTSVVLVPEDEPAIDTSGGDSDYTPIETRGTVAISGKVSQYSSTGSEDGTYRRLLPVKIFQAIVYKQRMEDVLHRFTVRVEQGVDALGYQKYTDIPVNVHGTIAGGLQIFDNTEVEVHGRFYNNILMAERINIINNGYRSRVGFQRSVRAIAYGILAAVMAAFVLFVAISSNGSFVANLKEFCTIWLAMAAVLSVLYFITRFTRFGILSRMVSNRRRSFPLMGILLISLALAFIFANVFGSFAGFGSYMSEWFYSAVPTIVIIIVVIFIIKKIF